MSIHLGSPAKDPAQSGCSVDLCGIDEPRIRQVGEAGMGSQHSTPPPKPSSVPLTFKIFSVPQKHLVHPLPLHPLLQGTRIDTLSALGPENSEMNQRGSGGTGNTGPLGFPSDSPTKHRCWKGKGYDFPMVTCSALWHGQARQARLPKQTLQR